MVRQPAVQLEAPHPDALELCLDLGASRFAASASGSCFPRKRSEASAQAFKYSGARLCA
jgi:hypothetical protein